MCGIQLGRTPHSTLIRLQRVNVEAGTRISPAVCSPCIVCLVHSTIRSKVNRTLNFLACLLAICASGGITVEAQTYGWEQIYAVEENEDYRFESIAFGGDGTLYGIHHYGFAAQPPGSDEWEERCSFYEDCRYLSGGPLTELGADTLFVNTGWSVQRTVDGGLLWEIVYPDGTPFYERIPFFQTNSGMLLIPTGDVIPYSNDRGETWIEAPYPGTGGRIFQAMF